MFAPVFLKLAFLSSVFCWPYGFPASQPASAVQDLSMVGTRILRDGPPGLTTRDPARWPADAAPIPIGAVVPAMVRRRLRVVVYCRYSSDEQNPRSLEEQAAKCREYLKVLGIHDAEIIEITDPETSGELLRRGGIDEVRDLIRSGGCDLIVTEDASRLYRNTTFAMGLFDEAADAGVRVVAINDRIDTADEHWRMNAHFASIRGEMYNADTAARIRRSVDGRWRDGYAVGLCKPGYRRIPTRPATEREPARGPYRDEKDPQWTPVIRKAFEMTASDDAIWKVAQFLADSGLPKTSSARQPVWTKADTWRFLRDPIYKGQEVYRRKHSVKKYTTGRSVLIETPPEQVLRRDMPHLAHIPAWLWEKANTAIDRRRIRPVFLKGKDHPLIERPRDRRGPLSNHFFCGVCGAPMYCDGDMYRCADCKRRRMLKLQGGDLCWNRCSPRPKVVHAKIGAAIVDRLLDSTGTLQVILEHVQRIVAEGDETVQRRVVKLRQQEADLVRKCKRLAEAVEKGGEMDALVEQLQARQAELTSLHAEIERLTEQKIEGVPVPTAEDLGRMLEQVKVNLLDQMGSQVGPLIRRLTSPIRAVPYKLFDCDRFVTRAHFTLNLLGLLPERFRDLLEDRLDPAETAKLGKLISIPMVVDLFKPADRVRHAKAVAELRDQGLSIREAGERLGLPHWRAKDAWNLARKMAELGLQDPFVKVTSKPKLPRRWVRRSQHAEADDAALEGRVTALKRKVGKARA